MNKLSGVLSTKLKHIYLHTHTHIYTHTHEVDENISLTFQLKIIRYAIDIVD